jgi:putative cardiolipin synthase
MKKAFMGIGAGVIALSAICWVQGSAQKTGANLWRSLASNPQTPLAPVEPKVRDDIARDGAEELMRPEQKKRKIEVCGADSISVDTLSNFKAQPTGWFPGKIKVLADPHEALLAKLLLIERAQMSIDISTYIFEADESAMAILDGLRLALLRGVNVRLMIDAGGSMGEALKDQYRALRSLLLAKKLAEKSGLKPGQLDIVIFHPLGRFNTILSNAKEKVIDNVDLSSETGLNWDRRSHDKIFMIDKEIPEVTMAIVGGRNIHNAYYGYPQVDQDTYEDMEILTANDPGSRDSRKISNTLGKHYQNLFCSKGNRWLGLERIEAMGNLPSRHALLRMEGGFDRLLNEGGLRELYREMKGASGYAFLEEGWVRGRLMHGNEIQNLKRPISDVIVDPNAPFVEKFHNGDSIYTELVQLLAKADKTIDVCTPYVFVAENERDCLKKWVMEKAGRKIRLLSNSSATSDSALAMATFQHESAPEFMREGHYRCEDPVTHQVTEGEFDNHDLKIQVYQLGRLDNKMFKKGEVRDSRGQRVAPANFYGKLHSKYGIIDGRISFVGSHNLDQRSRRLNSETVFFVDSSKIGADLTQEFEKSLARSYLYGDPDLAIMNARPELKMRKRLMSILAFINEHIPQAAFAN